MEWYQQRYCKSHPDKLPSNDIKVGNTLYYQFYCPISLCNWAREGAKITTFKLNNGSNNCKRTTQTGETSMSSFGYNTMERGTKRLSGESIQKCQQTLVIVARTLKILSLPSKVKARFWISVKYSGIFKSKSSKMTLYLQGTTWMTAAPAVPMATSSSVSEVKGVSSPITSE